jgi:hypothetical protein
MGNTEMDSPDHGALYLTAEQQAGYFTAAQARQVGYAYSQQHYHCSTGNWLRLDRGLSRLRDFRPGEREDLIRWSLWSRDRKGIPQAVVSHETALTVHDLSDVIPERVHLTAPCSFRKRVPAGCVLHFASLAEEEIDSRPGYSLIIPLRTLIDVVGSAVSQEHLDAAVKEALESGLVRRSVLGSVRCQPAARTRLDRALASSRQGETKS